MMAIRQIVLLAAAGAAITALPTRLSAQDINGAGATFPYPIYSKWFQAYTQAHPNVKFNYQSVGSGAGIAQYKAGTVFFGASDAPLSDAEAATMPQKTLHIPTVAGAIVLTYNLPGASEGLRLSGETIAEIYLGKVKNWNDAPIVKDNPGRPLPAMPITVIHRSDGSGTTYIFTHYLAAVSNEWGTKVGSGKSVSWPVGLGGNGNAGVAGLVRNQPGAIGYVELAYALQQKLVFGPVKNKAGNWVSASLASTTEAANSGAAAMKKDVRVSIVNGPGKETYPISGFTYLLVPKDPKDAAKGKAFAEFLKWAMGPGQQMAETLVYAALPKSVIAINEAAINSIGH